MTDTLRRIADNEIKRNQFFLLFVAFAYLVWGYFLNTTSPEINDPIWARVLVSAVIIGFWLHSSYRPTSVDAMNFKIFFCSSLAVVHTTLILWLNGYMMPHIFGLFVLVAAIHNILNNIKYLVAFTFLVGMAMSGSFVNDHPEIPPSLIAVGFLTMMIAATFSYISKQELILELSHSEQNKSTVLNSMREGILLQDKSGMVVSFNPAALKILDITEEQILGKSYHEIKWKAVHEDGSEFSTPQHPAILALRTGQIQTQVPMGLTRFDGSITWITVNAVPIFEKSTTQASHVLCTFADVTQEKINQKLILDQQAMLSSAAKLSSLGEMAAGIAHEINNPLAVISGKASQLGRLVQKGDVDPESTAPLLNKIQETVKRINQIIVSMKNLARNSQNDPFELADIRRVIDDTMTLCKEKLYKSNVKIDVYIENSILLECRPGQLSQVVLNLIQNAHDAIQELPEKWIHVDVGATKNFVRIQVTDSGTGIHKDLQNKIMQPFFTTKEIGKGTGLGLSLSSSIATAHHGRLFYDETSKNTSFVLELPLRQPEKMSRAI